MIEQKVEQKVDTDIVDDTELPCLEAKESDWELASRRNARVHPRCLR